ncbi:uncharacterized protein [Lolium perenne]|uniref:uncharacterized protein n=1 Tax=Lolium perenne TaxID=4522 RepID=UPI003A99C5EB
MFGARVEMAGALQIWHSRAPPNCRVFLWLAARNICWTADMLSMHGLPHPTACPFCDQVGESLDHLMMDCVLARVVWATCLRWWGKLHWMPQPDTKLVYRLKEKRGSQGADHDFWTCVTLICWCLWPHRNDVVFEAKLWRAAGRIVQRRSRTSG